MAVEKRQKYKKFKGLLNTKDRTLLKQYYYFTILCKKNKSVRWFYEGKILSKKAPTGGIANGRGECQVGCVTVYVSQ